MKTGGHNAVRTIRAALAAAIVILFVSTASAQGQHAGAPPPRAGRGPAMRPARPGFQTAHPQITRPQANRPLNQNRYILQQTPRRLQGNGMQRPAPGYMAPALRPGNPGNVPRNVIVRPGYAASPNAGLNRPAYTYPGAAPPGHLGDWLNQHRGLPVQEQERMLRNDPSFYRLPPADQQRLIGQLHQVNQMPEEQRQRRLARAEALEHMSPQDRMNLNSSSRRLAALPPDRQTLVSHAFRDLRSVPLEQRQMVLNSARYQGVFSPEERGILSDFLSVEPYEPAR
jgi:hypothetical protein